MSDSQLTAPLFRGATRPPMMLGVPIEPLLKVIAPCVLLVMALWPVLKFSALLGFFPIIGIIFWMRDMSKRDDQYLNMLFLQIQESAQIRPNRVGSIHVLPPRPIKKDSVNE